MTTRYQEAIDSKIRELNKMTVLHALLLKLTKLNGLSETAHINAYGSEDIFITVYNRDDLAIALSAVEGVWAKRPSETGSIVYTNRIDDNNIKIFARDDALPPTCKVVEETVEHPARAAYTETVRRIVCDL